MAGEFKLVQSEFLLRDIEVNAPDDSQLKFKQVKWLYMESEEFVELTKVKGDDLLAELLVGWESCTNGAGIELGFSEDALAIISKPLWCRQQLFDHYASAVTGQDRKNFSASLQLGLLHKMAQQARPKKRKATKKKRRRS